MSEQKLPGQDAVNPLHKGEGVDRRRRKEERGREGGRKAMVAATVSNHFMPVSEACCASCGCNGGSTCD